jgi:GNAT superfamily N-acetyltransferase
MLKAPGVAHVTVLKAGQRPISIHFNLTSKSVIHACVIAHDPFLSKQSPGKLHFYYLALMLCDAGINQIDLTPGGDAYKERFADAWDQVHELALHSTRAACFMDALSHRSQRIARKLLRKMDISPARAVQFVRRLKSLASAGGALTALRALCRWVASDRQMRIYGCATGGTAGAPTSQTLSVDAIDHLLAYAADSNGPSAQEFMSDAMRRIAQGSHFFSCVEDGRLLHVAWLTPRPDEQLLNETAGAATWPAGSGLIDGLYTAAGAQGRGLMALSLRAIVNAAQAQKVSRLFVVVESRDAAAISQIESAGFVLERRMIEQTRFGVRRWWKVPPDSADARTSPDPCLMQVPTA